MGQSSQQIANLIGLLTPEHRILRYVAKMEKNANNPSWEKEFNVSKVKIDGELDLAKVKAHFAERNILSSDEFDDAVSSGVLRGLITSNLKSKGINLAEVSDILDAKQDAENKEKDDAQRLIWANSLK